MTVGVTVARRSPGASAFALLSLAALPGWADEASPPPAGGQEQPAGSANAALTAPSMAGPLTANPDPAKFDAGPIGNLFVTGALTGLLRWQSNPVQTDRSGRADISNAQAFIQKINSRSSGSICIGHMAHRFILIISKNKIFNR